MPLKFKDIISGAIIYAIGDSIASLLLNEFQLTRLLGMMFVGATVYAYEIPNYFIWIDKKAKQENRIKETIYKTLLAILYFNPLWIARHLFFIKLFSQKYDNINLSLLEIAFWSKLLFL